MNDRNFKMLGKFSIPVPAVSSPTQIPWPKGKKKEKERERENILVLWNLLFLRDCHIIML